jgi:hypothetical protein
VNQIYRSAYRKFMKDFSVVVQFCLAHLIRDIKFLRDQKDEPTKRYGERLRKLFGVIHSHDDCNASVFTAFCRRKNR